MDPSYPVPRMTVGRRPGLSVLKKIAGTVKLSASISIRFPGMGRSCIALSKASACCFQSDMILRSLQFPCKNASAER
ncbi:hypothetical protein FOFC_19988 [Fusarium oxysporum]|nr:hypothetical protein FOFC_19988 [Fusarium oxysporum]